jgi:hypothetical protein
MRNRGLLLMLFLLVVAVSPSTYAVDGPQTDIYYYDECGEEVGYKWKECGNSGWQMTGTTASWMLVVTFSCDTFVYQRQYYNGCLTSACQVTEQEWTDHWANTEC